MDKSFNCPMNMTPMGMICCPYRSTAQPECQTTSRDLPWGCSLPILAVWPALDNLRKRARPVWAPVKTSRSSDGAPAATSC